ncbi:MAG: M20/M25/M40 family metallo-hydrolase [Planctomycetes bacterium]|nr:M20/M25/M40 family metallo-hydrolase [Planctomycetota bacterium]
MARSPEDTRALARLLRLLSISAPTGEEAPIRDAIIEELIAIGVPPDAIREDDAPARIELPCQAGNLIVRMPGTMPGPARLLSAHIDTVALARGAEPEVRGDRILPKGPTALGGDDRTGVAAILAAIDEIERRRLPHPPLALLLTVREESGVRGARAVRPEDLGAPAMGFNFDGGEPEEITIGATGSMHLEIDVRGVAAHAGVHPDRGISAIAIFAAAAADLDRGGWLGKIRHPGGAGTSNIGAVRAGDATNVIPDRLSALAEARSHDPAFLARIVAEYGRAFADAAAAHANEAGGRGEASIRADQVYHAFRLPEDAPVVRAAVAAVRDAGLEPRFRISDGGLDANWLVRYGIPAASLGAGAHGVHTTGEHVMIDEFLTACRLALALASVPGTTEGAR